MEIRKTSPGYPCSSYIVRKIKNTDELWLYAKSFVQNAKERGLTPSETLVQLTATLSMISPESDFVRPNFTELGSNDDERCQYLLTNPLVGNIKSCETLYRKIDSHTGTCRLCPYSKLYRNKHEEREYAILKYMLKSEANLNYVADHIGEEFFESCMDVSMGIPVPKAYVLPMCKILVQSLLKNNIRLMIFSPLKETFFLSGDTYDVVWEDAYRTFPRNRKIPVSLSNNPMWQNVLKSALKEKIMNAKELTREDVNEIFNDYVLNELSSSTVENNSIKVGKEEPQQLMLEDILVTMQQTDTAVKKKPVSVNNVPSVFKVGTQNIKPAKEEVISPNVPSEEADETTVDEVTVVPSAEISSPENDTENTDRKPQEFSEPVVMEAENSTEGITENNNVDSEPVLPSETAFVPANSSEPTGFTHEMTAQKTEEQTKSASVSVAVLEPPSVMEEPLEDSATGEHDTAATTPSSKVASEETSVTEKSAKNKKEEVLQEDEIRLLNERNLILLATLPDFMRKNNILHIRKNKQFPSSFYQGILRDKQLYIEVVRAEDGRYLYLMWSRHMKKYLTMSLMDTTDEMKKLLSYKSIKKICHTPYVLYGVSKLYHVPVKNVFSLQTVYGRLFPSAPTLQYKDFCETFIGKSKYGEHTTKEYSELCPFLGGMPMYREMHNTFINMIQTYGAYSMFIKDCYLDEALGCSYYYGLNFSDKGTLFVMTGNNQYFFHKDYYRKTITQGRCYGYFIKDEIDAIALFQYVLQRLAEKGIFRTTNLQLLGMDNKQFQLFVETNNETYISSLIDMLVFEYGKTYLSKPLILHNVITEI